MSAVAPRLHMNRSRVVLKGGVKLNEHGIEFEKWNWVNDDLPRLGTHARRIVGFSSAGLVVARQTQKPRLLWIRKSSVRLRAASW